MWDSNEKSVKPSETVLRDVFETFGPLSAIDIPLLDPFREKIHAIQKKMMEPIKEGLFDNHHIVPKYKGGTDEFDNMVTISRTCHTMFHYCNWKLVSVTED